MSYPTFQDRYGSGAVAPSTAPQGPAGQSDPQTQMQDPWAQLLQTQDEMGKKLDPWALDAQNMGQQQSGGKA